MPKTLFSRLIFLFAGGLKNKVVEIELVKKNLRRVFIMFFGKPSSILVDRVPSSCKYSVSLSKEQKKWTFNKALHTKKKIILLTYKMNKYSLSTSLLGETAFGMSFLQQGKVILKPRRISNQSSVKTKVPTSHSYPPQVTTNTLSL